MTLLKGLGVWVGVVIRKGARWLWVDGSDELLMLWWMGGC